MRAAAARGAAWIVLGVLLGPASLPAATPGASWSHDLAKELMSPYCPGRTLADCPSAEAAELRGWIADQEEQARSRADVEAELLARFGDVIRQAPDPRGFGLAAYLIPGVAILTGAALVIAFLRRQARLEARAPARPAGPVDPDLERVVDEELDRG